MSDTLGAWAGGPTQNAFELHWSLDRLPAISSHLVSAKGDAEPPQSALRPPPVEQRPTGRVAKVVRLARLLLTCDVLLFNGYYTWWLPVLALLGRVTGKAVVIVPHGSLTRHQRKEARAKKTVWEVLPGPVVRACSTAWVVQSEMERRELLEVFPRLRIRVGGIGTVLPSLPPEGRAPGTGTADSPVRLLSLSRIAPKKRIDLMIDAVEELRKRGVSTRLVVAGSGDDQLEADLRRRAERQGVADAVSFVGMLVADDREQAYADAQFFLAPSDDENFGMSPTEALARAVPTVASTQVASLAALPDSAGAVLEAPTGATIADAVQRLLAADQAGLRSAARRFAEQQFEWGAVAGAWAVILTELAGPRRQRRPAGTWRA